MSDKYNKSTYNINKSHNFMMDDDDEDIDFKQEEYKTESQENLEDSPIDMQNLLSDEDEESNFNEIEDSRERNDDNQFDLSSLLKDEEDEESYIDFDKDETTTTDLNKEHELSEKDKNKIEKAKEIEGIVAGIKNVPISTDAELRDADGEKIEPRDYENGYMKLENIHVDDIVESHTYEKSMRLNERNIQALKDRIKVSKGLLTPIVVVPLGEPVEIEGEITFDKYAVIDGRLRLQACKELGIKEIPSLVDTTIPEDLIGFYESIINVSDEYTPTEQLIRAKENLVRYPNLTVDTVGIGIGSLYISLAVFEAKDEFPNIYNKFEKRELTAEKAFKKIQKEREKLEQPQEPKEEEESDEDLTSVADDTRLQTIEDRQVLPSNLSKEVEQRDRGTCQCCYEGQNDSSLIELFEKHHIIPVQYGGLDILDNLILLCPNCHKLAHKYEQKKWTPKTNENGQLKEHHQNIIILGNMLRKIRKANLEKLERADKKAFEKVNTGKSSLAKELLSADSYANAMHLFDRNPMQTYLNARDDSNNVMKTNINDFNIDADDVENVLKH